MAKISGLLWVTACSSHANYSSILPRAQEPRNLLAMANSSRFIRSTWLIASLTLVSRVLGLLRECIFATFFSTGEILSAFRIAFMLPNLARRLFGEGALSAAMIPVLTQSLQNHGEEKSRKFVGTMFKVLFTVLLAGMLLAELVIVVWRMSHDDLALELSAWLMPYMAMICLVAIGGGVLQVRGHFATPAVAPALLNIAIIAGTWIGAKGMNLAGAELIHVICISVLVGGATQLALTAWALASVSFFPIFSRVWKDEQLKSVTLLMGPMILGLSAVQINTLMDYLIAYLFVVEEGERVGPAVLGYAQYLYQLPLGVFGIALATAIFPVLSEKASQNDHAGLADVLDRGLRTSLFIALPASVGLIFVAHPLVAALYQRGEFDASDTRRVANVLIFYCIGMVAYFTHHLFVRTFYALKNSKTPARIAMYMVGINFIMNLSLVFYLQEKGLALATAVCAIVQVLWLRKKLDVRCDSIQRSNTAYAILKMVFATIIMACALSLIIFIPAIHDSLQQHAIIKLGVLVATGAIAYMIASYFLRIEELKSILHLRRHK